MNSATVPNLISTSISRAGERRDRRDRRLKLIHALRTAAWLGSLEAYDCCTLDARCSLARLVQGCDEVLRQLVNVPKERR